MNRQVTELPGVVVLRGGYSQELLHIYNADGSEWKSFIYSDTFADKALQPYSLKPENRLLVFRCVGEIDGYYKVLVNERKEDAKYIKQADIDFQFQPWEQHLLKLFAVDFDAGQNPIRETPSNNAKKITFDKEQFYHPVKINGDWLMVSDDEGKEGWIRWRDKKGDMILEVYYEA